jgi:hypothetical protein
MSQNAADESLILNESPQLLHDFLRRAGQCADRLPFGHYNIERAYFALVKSSKRRANRSRSGQSDRLFGK